VVWPKAALDGKNPSPLGEHIKKNEEAAQEAKASLNASELMREEEEGRLRDDRKSKRLSIARFEVSFSCHNSEIITVLICSGFNRISRSKGRETNANETRELNTKVEKLTDRVQELEKIQNAQKQTTNQLLKRSSVNGTHT
jgi:hypothetical protein